MDDDMKKEMQKMKEMMKDLDMEKMMRDMDLESSARGMDPEMSREMQKMMKEMDLGNMMKGMDIDKMIRDVERFEKMDKSKLEEFGKKDFSKFAKDMEKYEKLDPDKMSPEDMQKLMDDVQKQLADELGDMGEALGISEYLKPMPVGKCPQCNTPVERNMKFCVECGKRLV